MTIIIDDIDQEDKEKHITSANARRQGHRKSSKVEHQRELNLTLLQLITIVRQFRWHYVLDNF